MPNPDVQITIKFESGRTVVKDNVDVINLGAAYAMMESAASKVEDRMVSFTVIPQPEES